MIRRRTLFSALALLLAATTMTLAAPTTAMLIGEVREVTGNRMPGPGPHSLPRPFRGKVWVVRGEWPGQGPFLTKSTLPVGASQRVTTDTAGNFRLSLPPGTYTVFLETPRGLYRNEFDGRGYYVPTVLRAGETTRIQLLMDAGAVY